MAAVKVIVLADIQILIKDRNNIRYKIYSKKHSELVDVGRGTIFKKNVGQVSDVSGKVSYRVVIIWIRG